MSTRHLILLGFLLAAGFAGPVRAIPRVDVMEALDVAEGQALPGECVVIAQTARVAGTCNDDLFLMSQKDAVLAGRFENDVWTLADRILMAGEIRDHARLAGRTMQIDGVVGNGLTAFGGTIRLGSESVARGGVRLMAEEALLMGRVEGNAKVKARSVTLSGQIAGDLDVEALDLVLLPGARVEGGLFYTADADLTLPEGVTVGGGVHRRPIPGPAPLRTRAMGAFAFFSAALVAGAGFLGLLPRAAGGAVRRMRANFWACLLAGTAALILLPLAAAVAAATGVGLPLAAALMAAGFLAFYLGHLAAALWLGSVFLLRRGEQSFGSVFPALAMGLAIVYFASLLPPAVGLALWMTLGLAGGGALILEAAGRPSAPVPPPLPDPKER